VNFEDLNLGLEDLDVKFGDHRLILDTSWIQHQKKNVAEQAGNELALYTGKIEQKWSEFLDAPSSENRGIFRKPKAHHASTGD